jgi:hypothetical protein
MKHRIKLFAGEVDIYRGSLLPDKVNAWLEENADRIQVEKIEHQQSISNNRGIQVTVMVHYLEK